MKTKKQLRTIDGKQLETVRGGFEVVPAANQLTTGITFPSGDGSGKS